MHNRIANKIPCGIIKLSSRQRPFTGAAVARSAKGVETPKLHQKIPLWVGLFGKPLFRLNPPSLVSYARNRGEICKCLNKYQTSFNRFFIPFLATSFNDHALFFSGKNSKKTYTAFRKIAFDHVHELNNKVIKSRASFSSLLNNDELCFFVRWIMSYQRFNFIFLNSNRRKKSPEYKH